MSSKYQYYFYLVLGLALSAGCQRTILTSPSSVPPPAPASTDSSTPTPFQTPTSTPTGTSTRTPTPTHSATFTLTPSASPTNTVTPLATVAAPTLFPNPVLGPGPVTLALTLSEGGDVSVKVFSSAFRRVLEKPYSQVPAGTSDLTLVLRDGSGKPLANGIYYILVEGPQVRKVLKLLLLH